MSDLEQVEILIDEAEVALDQGDAAVALARCQEALDLSPGHPGAQFVRGDALRALGDLEAAVEAYRSAALGSPDHAPSWASLALTQFELMRIEEARRSALRSVRADPSEPDGWWVRSLLREWTGDFAGAERALLHAHWLDPRRFPLPPRLDVAEIEAILRDALEGLAPEVSEFLANVPFVLDELPSEELLRQYDPPASPLELLGTFRGSPVADRSTEPWSALPPTIILFRRNLERHALDRDQLVAELRLTLFREVSHPLFLDEEEDRGQ